jgi:putative hydrolase of the HAD superfamily
MPPVYLLCDLDETLYPSSCGLMQAVSARMSAFVADFLGVGPEQAAQIRSRLRMIHGTTLTGLMREYGLQVAERYLAYTHDVPVADFLDEDPSLSAALGSICLPKAVLTNSPLEHAERVLDRLGIRDRFERVFDLRFNGFTGKPDPAVYTRALGQLGRRASEVLLVDNHLDYLAPFRAMGGQVLLIEEGGDGAARDGVPTLGDIKELPAWLAARRPA